MLNQKSHHVLRPESTEKPLLSISAMAYAEKVAAEFEKLETGYRNGLYNFFGRALISYRKFLKDQDGYKELLGQDNIAGLREKPELKATSRLVLYFLTNAQSGAERNSAGKYARIVDYLHREGVDNAAAADHVRSVGGMDAVLNKARGREVLKSADETLQDDDRDFDQEEEPHETIPTSTSEHTDELFDPEQDLSIRVRSDTYARVLGENINIGESFFLECKKTGSIGHDGIRIVGKLVDPLSA
jgi:hypothetical protein